MEPVCNKCGWSGGHLKQHESLLLCNKCAPLPSSEDVKRKLIEVSQSRREEQRQRFARRTNPAEYLEDLSADKPEFFKALEEYQAGNYTLVDGGYDSFLAWAADRVYHGGYEVPDWMEKKFRARCAYYCEQRASGYDLVSFERGGHQVDELISMCYEVVTALNEKSVEILASIRDQYKKRGWISPKQLSMLRVIREKGLEH